MEEKKTKTKNWRKQPSKEILTQNKYHNIQWNGVNNAKKCG